MSAVGWCQPILTKIPTAGINNAKMPSNSSQKVAIPDALPAGNGRPNRTSSVNNKVIGSSTRSAPACPLDSPEGARSSLIGVLQQCL